MDVDPEGEFPFLVRDILDRFEGRLVRRVVDENVDAAKLCDRLVDDRTAMRGRSNIARDQDRLAPRLFHEPLRFLRIFVLVKISDEDVCALPRIRDSNRSPYSAVRTRDHRLLPGELATAVVALF